MSLATILYLLIIRPLELIFEVIFVIADRFINNAGLSIIFLSLAVNLLVLPLYKRADELQAEERDRQADMEHWVSHIKKTFKGDERFMMLQTYYKQKKYKQVYALNGMLSLLLQIPFFIAAYNFLSNLGSLKGMSFGPIRDLGVQDAMFMIGNFPVNVLPILMTIINIVSGAIYTKGQPLKAKLQIYGVALVFLVLLYNSPSGLVFYWLLNNVFSLVKNIFYKLKNPKLVISVMLSVLGALLLVVVAITSRFTLKQKVIFACLAVIFQIPSVICFAKSKGIKFKSRLKPEKEGGETAIFILGALLLSVLTGLLIPSNVIKSSTDEFIDILEYTNPSIYIVYALLISLGLFVIWVGIYYYLSDSKVRRIFSACVWVFCGVAIVDHMFFGTRLGVLTPNLQYETGLVFSKKEYLINAAVVLAVMALFYFVFRYQKGIVRLVLVAGLLALTAVGIMNVQAINKEYHKVAASAKESAEELAKIPLSRNGQNVIVFMLDRAMGSQVPYIMAEKPELEEKFDGFTYYHNTVSFGQFTNFATPALYGGYEYTPEKINERDDERLVDKQNEALKVMPFLFDDNGYKVTVTDPPYAGYRLIPDLSIYSDHPNISGYITKGKMNNYMTGSGEAIDKIRKRNFFFFSIVREVPLVFQGTLYSGGMYNGSDDSEGVASNIVNVQVMDGLSKSYGYSQLFTDTFSVLKSLKLITHITDDEQDTFLMMANDATHEPCLLQEPNYEPKLNVDNTAYDTDLADRYVVDGVHMRMDLEKQVIHYHANIASLMALGEWFDYLREEGVYDNTRIILVSDHGRNLEQFDMWLKSDGDPESTEFFLPLLMVKDFNAHGYNTSEEFMTNADVPHLATDGVIEDAKNPFSGNRLDGREKFENDGKQKVFSSRDFDTQFNQGNRFNPGYWYTVHDNVYDMNNWEYIGEY